MSHPVTIIQRRDLGDLVKEYALEKSEQLFIGLQLMPIFNTALQSGNYPIIPIEQMLKPRNVNRASGGGYNRGDWQFKQGQYACVEKGWEEVVRQDMAKNYASYFDAEATSAMVAQDVILRAQEQRIASLIQSVTPTSASVSWKTKATATPKDDIETGIKHILDYTGVRPDTLQLTYNNFNFITRCDQFLDTAKYTSNPLAMGFEAQRTLVASFLGVSRILVGNAIVNSADEGLDFSPNQIWDDDRAFLCVTSSGPMENVPQWGRTIQWEDDSPQNVNAESYEEVQTNSDIIRVRHYNVEKILNPNCGYALDGLAV